MSALWSYIKALLKLGRGGFKFADEELAIARNDVCQDCKHYNAPEDRCGICGCWLSPRAMGTGRLFSKVYFPKEECPLRKW